MQGEGFRRLFWGFLFIMVDFRIQGIDILPDIAGFILFAIGFSTLAANSVFFEKAKQLNIPMIIISIFQIYEAPAVNEGGIQLSALGPFGILVGIAAIILTLLVVYNLFMGIKDLAEQKERMDLADEAGNRWRQFLLLQIAVIFAFILFIIPPLLFLYIIALLIASIVLTIVILGFIKRCEESL